MFDQAEPGRSANFFHSAMASSLADPWRNRLGQWGASDVVDGMKAEAFDFEATFRALYVRVARVIARVVKDHAMFAHYGRN